MKILSLLAIIGLTLTINSCGKKQKVSTEDASRSTAKTAEMSPLYNLDAENNILQGHDVVEYFENRQSVKGKQEFVAQFGHANFLFSSQENKDKFQKNPTAYIPQNGGYCTFGVVVKKKFDGNPNVWLIENGKLFVFLNEEVKTKFQNDLTGNLKKVEENWQLIKDKHAETL